jgi:hypothetical protein
MPFRPRAALIALAASLCVLAPTSLAGQEAPPAPRSPLTAEQWRADLRAMMEALPRVHRNVYHTTPKPAFDSAAAALDARIPSLSREEIVMEMAGIVAMVGDGHTNIYPTRDPAIGFHALPVALYLFRDGLYVRAADRAHAELVGARVLAIGGVSAESAYARVRPYVGRDNEMGVRFFAPHLLVMPEVLHALHLAASADSARFELHTAAGRRTVWLRPDRLAEMMPGDTDPSWRHRAGWVDARDAARAPEPLWLSVAPDTVLWWFTRLPGTRTVYAQLNQVRDGPETTLEEWTDGLLAYLDTARIERLVLDLRLDRGGNGEVRMPLVRGLLRNPRINAPGGLMVLIGRSTWSAAQFLVDDLDKYSHAVFVGEPTGSKGNTYGDSRSTRLPNSGITVRASIYYWQEWSPYDERPWLAPSLAAELTFADYRANRDPALQAALAYVAAPPLAHALRDAVAAGDTAGARARLRTFRADPAHAYVDAHPLVDEAALHFYRRHDLAHATWLFALAATEYPQSVRAHSNLSVMYREAGNAGLERAELSRILELEPGNAGAAARLREMARR